MLSANRRLLEELQSLDTSQPPLGRQEAGRILTKALDKLQAEKNGLAEPEFQHSQKEDPEPDFEAEGFPVLVKPGRRAYRRIASLCAACFAAGLFLFLLFLNSVNPTAAESLPIVGGIVERVNRQLRFPPKEPEIPSEAEPSLPPSTPEPTEPASPPPQQAAETRFQTASADGRLTGEISSLTGEGFTLRLTLAFAPADGELKQYRCLTYQNAALKLDGQTRQIRLEPGLRLDLQEDGDVWTGETEIDILDYEGFGEEELQAELTFSGFTAWDSPDSGTESAAAGDAITFRLALTPGSARLCPVENAVPEGGEILLKQLFVNSSKLLVGLEIPDRIPEPVVFLCGEDGSRLEAVRCEKLGPGSSGSSSEWRGIAALPPESGERLLLQVSGQDGVTLAEYTASLLPGEPSPAVSSPPPGLEGENSGSSEESGAGSHQPVPSVQPTVSPSEAPEA